MTSWSSSIRANEANGCSHLTTIDLALSIVIIFLLSAISVRALLFIHDRAHLRLLRRRRR